MGEAGYTTTAWAYTCLMAALSLWSATRVARLSGRARSQSLRCLTSLQVTNFTSRNATRSRARPFCSGVQQITTCSAARRWLDARFSFQTERVGRGTPRAALRPIHWISPLVFTNPENDS